MQPPVSTLFSFPPQIFMYDFISDYLLKLARRAQLKLSHTHTPITPESFYVAFYDVVKRDRIAPVVAFVNSHPIMFRMFKEDFVKRTLHMHTMNSIWLDACVFVLDGLCTARGSADVCCLFVAKVLQKTKKEFWNASNFSFFRTSMDKKLVISTFASARSSSCSRPKTSNCRIKKL
jgi:hypothetical protein